MMSLRGSASVARICYLPRSFGEQAGYTPCQQAAFRVTEEFRALSACRLIAPSIEISCASALALGSRLRLMDVPSQSNDEVVHESVVHHPSILTIDASRGRSDATFPTLPATHPRLVILLHMGTPTAIGYGSSM